MRLLCVEDDRVNALLLEQSCLQADATLVLSFAESGAEALTLAAGFAPDLLVLDLHLPDMDGHALLAKLRDCLGQPDLPAVLCTATPRGDVSAAAAQAGFTQVWDKPVSADEVRTLLSTLRARR
jgi:two-component system, OmpR family, response regulator